ncbi:DUF7536 family protein [Halopenitus persicus]|uniref:Uncharacterized protein n=1 Tax=Halopenitus persicus TaxID=1048396 RepID=A0A1H3IA13_9EURY|nr:hypothetical protein [Halopenitus persicus]QHS17033.1 hypothetical protein GWK26_07675 [haloarchaeon 3A1-DGR]SDY24566.1 hypothetical protein SAMN05216564_10444 [Halopenitus persicus]
MSEKRPDGASLSAFFAALDVRRNAAIGGAVGLAVGIGAYLFRLLEPFGPFTGTREYPVIGPEGWFLLLAFVLAVTCGMLVTIALTARSAVRRTRELNE